MIDEIELESTFSLGVIDDYDCHLRWFEILDGLLGKHCEGS